MPEDEGGDDLVDPDDLDMGDDLDLGEDEIDPIGDLDLEGEGDLEGGDEDFESELDDLEGDDLGLEDELGDEEFVEAPQAEVKWTPTPTEDGTIHSEHKDGFVLRAKPLSSQQDSKIKYITQLYKGDKMIEKGTIWVENEVDPREYLQNVSDRILDR
jgi:hypothetical protein